jgi:hypothetical protein
MPEPSQTNILRFSGNLGVFVDPPFGGREKPSEVSVEISTDLADFRHTGSSRVQFKVFGLFPPHRENSRQEALF